MDKDEYYKENFTILYENKTINLIVGSMLLFFAFIMVLYSIYGSKFSITINLDFLLLIIVIIVNLLGYAIILLPALLKRIQDTFVIQSVLISFLVVPFICILSILFINLMSTTQKTTSSSDILIVLRYLLYCLVPVTTVTLSRSRQLVELFENKLFAVILFLFLLFWTWWGIEFTNDLQLFPNLVNGFSYFLNLLAITTLAWSFLAIWDFEIDRSLSRLFTFSNLKIIFIIFIILMVLIVPAGLATSFLQINFNHLLNMGILGAIAYLFLAILGVFLVQGIGEELLFRAFFFYILKEKIKNLDERYRGYVLITLFFIVAGLISLTPYVGLANSINNGIVNSNDIPLQIIYPIIGILYFVIGIVSMIRTKNLTYTMVLWSSMLFGWAHFEDWRYVIFATIAGLGYCETYRRTNNLFAASAIHMLVDVTWGAILSA